MISLKKKKTFKKSNQEKNLAMKIMSYHQPWWFFIPTLERQNRCISAGLRPAWSSSKFQDNQSDIITDPVSNKQK